MTSGYFIGLDLGQTSEYTALVVLERHGSGETAEFHARHLHRYPLGTSYPAIADDMAKLAEKEPLHQSFCEVAIDGTGVGQAVVEMFRQKNIRPSMTVICITGGTEVTGLAGMLGVPKRDLVGCVQAALQTARLKIAASLPEADTLTHELQNFQTKATGAANDIYAAWREGAHDDLVLATALALWCGRQPPPQVPAGSYSLSLFR